MDRGTALAMKVASAAASLFGNTVEQISQTINTGRNVTIQITNNCDAFTLANPRTHNISGYCHHPPQPTIITKSQETCSFSKTAYSARGSIGVLMYQILNNERNPVGELAIMFSVPYNYSLYENWFALGIYEPDISCDDNLFNKMYYDYDYNNPFSRCKGTGGVVPYFGKGVAVKGTMSAGGQSIIKVELTDEGPVVYRSTRGKQTRVQHMQ
ncbi:bryoporin-like [Colossoma macropomum]|uniref:bryoporin-like n=1 Tax=Colossoma macropomum TaxID=42526 RepID=UPI0018654004|nr:bryoporin-like [Colossoma macropomum]